MIINTKIGIIAVAALLIMMLFPAIVYAQVDIQTYQQEDSVKLAIKNTGKSPVYVFNTLKILGDKGNTLYTSQEPSSADVLRINPGISYTFEWNTDDVSEGTYTGIIYQGDNKRTLRAIPTNFVIRPRPGKPIFYTNKIFYKNGQSIDVIFRNTDVGTIYVNVNNWKITNLDRGTIVATLSKDCTFGYRDCGDSFEPLRFMKKIEQTWDQRDSSGNQVAPGNYMVTAEYSNDNPSSGTPDIKTISTKKFIILPPRR